MQEHSEEYSEEQCPGGLKRQNVGINDNELNDVDRATHYPNEWKSARKNGCEDNCERSGSKPKPPGPGQPALAQHHICRKTNEARNEIQGAAEGDGS